MMEVVFMTEEDARYGFSLAGTRQLTVVPGDAEAMLREIIADAGVGLLVIDERLLAEIDPKIYTEIEQGWPGLLVTLPAPKRDTDMEDELQRLIRRALGYHVRLEL